MTDEEIERLCSEATPGPWCVQGPWPTATIYVDDGFDGDVSAQLEPVHIASLPLIVPAGHSTRDVPDAKFIAAARTLVPALLADRRKWQREFERMENVAAGIGASHATLREENEQLLARATSAESQLRTALTMLDASYNVTIAMGESATMDAAHRARIATNARELKAAGNDKFVAAKEHGNG